MTTMSRSSKGLNGLLYGLSQFHFHPLSEHTIAGDHAVMELHARSTSRTG